MNSSLCALCQKAIIDTNFITSHIEGRIYFVHKHCLEDADAIFDEDDDLSMMGKNMFLFADDTIELNTSEDE